ncbi:hypothetical protein [Aquabacterium sp.]|uniref:hypothetical protein n=1 Tax=Aquabacterium sp. TaxID=1872578 RepID=UPI0037850375
MDATQGVRFYQQDFVTATTTQNNIDTGVFEVNVIQLRQSTGLASGYLNVTTSAGWVVRNLAVPPEEVYPYARVAADFDLGVASGTPVTSLGAAVDFSAAPATQFSGGTMVTHSVAPTTVAIGGASDEPLTGAPDAPKLDPVQYTSGSASEIIVQFDHPNIEAANNQCAPAAVANSLQYLKNNFGLPVPHAHKAGLRPSVSPGDNSLVGQIEEAMNRQVTDRRHGKGVGNGALKGKLNYLVRNKLDKLVQVTHMGVNADLQGDTNMRSDTIDGVTMTSVGKGRNLDLDTLYNALREGQNCEMSFSWSGTRPDGTAVSGGHAVDLTGGINTLGQRSLGWASDRNQRDDGQGAGFSGFEQAQVTGPDANGQYMLSGRGNRKIKSVICEKFVVPPATVKIIETIDPKGHKCCVQSPPPMLNVTVDKGELTVAAAGPTSSAAWLPLKGSIANGAFDAGSTAAVAGFAKVSTRFTGSYANGKYSGTISVGDKGELYGVPIQFRVEISEALPSAIRPAMRVNGLRQDLTVAGGELLKPSVSLTAGPYIGQSGDWFVVLGLADGRWLHFDLATMSWQDGIVPTYTGPLFELPYFGLPAVDTLPPGTHSFYFGFDTVPNGQLDFDKVVYERTQVTVKVATP